MNEIPKFFQTLCAKKQIYNASVEDLLFYFPATSHGDRIIKLENYDCICVGYKNNIKHCVRFKILKCYDIPLLGSHEILFYGKVIKVDSLTYFKKEILKFEDYVSFDKCTFILLEEKEKVFRLHTIRERIQLPLFSGGNSFNKTLTHPIENGIENTYIKVNEINVNQVIDNLTNTFINIYDQLGDDKYVLFLNITSQVFKNIIEFLYNETIDATHENITHNLDVEMQNSIDFLFEEEF